ncbi:hypothetical protein [Streptomyces caniscabiei]|uniref:hypothetical protein n=1 Tax=Streptomyces caniscabiei TaxID=2746961 RepID=UPI000765D807|nr:hypothetical protein [Streptomyces caniscabiei]
MQITEMQNRAAALLTAVRTEEGERRKQMLEEARLWINLAHTTPAPPTVLPAPVPEGTVMRLRTCGGALTVVIQKHDRPGRAVYLWHCLGCGSGDDVGTSSRHHARDAATEHARHCWVLPEHAPEACTDSQ